MEGLFFLLIAGAAPGGAGLEVVAARAFKATAAVDCLAEEDFAV